MKEIIRFVGGGLLAVSIGIGMLQYMAGWEKLLPVDTWLAQFGKSEEPGVEQWYGEAVKNKQVTAAYVPKGKCMARVKIRLKNWFVIRNSEGTELDFKVTSVRNREDGTVVPEVSSGSWIFPKAGVYEVFLECKGKEFRIPIPVNG